MSSASELLEADNLIADARRIAGSDLRSAVTKCNRAAQIFGSEHPDRRLGALHAMADLMLHNRQTHAAAETMARLLSEMESGAANGLASTGARSVARECAKVLPHLAQNFFDAGLVRDAAIVLLELAAFETFLGEHGEAADSRSAALRIDPSVGNLAALPVPLFARH